MVMIKKRRKIHNFSPPHSLHRKPQVLRQQLQGNINLKFKVHSGTYFFPLS